MVITRKLLNNENDDDNNNTPEDSSKADLSGGDGEDYEKAKKHDGVGIEEDIDDLLEYGNNERVRLNDSIKYLKENIARLDNNFNILSKSTNIKVKHFEK